MTIDLIQIVLPAGMSRTVWIAAALSSAWVYWIQETGIRKSGRWVREHKKAAMLCVIVAVILLSVASTGVYLLKRDSANGRFLLWKITGKAMVEQPFTGMGLGAFPAANAVLAKEPEVLSVAMQEMRNETEKIITSSASGRRSRDRVRRRS